MELQIQVDHFAVYGVKSVCCTLFLWGPKFAEPKAEWLASTVKGFWVQGVSLTTGSKPATTVQRKKMERNWRSNTAKEWALLQDQLQPKQQHKKKQKRRRSQRSKALPQDQRQLRQCKKEEWKEHAEERSNKRKKKGRNRSSQRSEAYRRINNS